MARSRDASLPYTQAHDCPRAYRITGTYEQVGPALRLRNVLVRSTARVLPPQVFEADFREPAAFVTRFLAQLLP